MTQLNRIDGSVIDQSEDLSFVQLVEKNKSYLEWADLQGVNLQGINLSGADLYRVNLSGVNLSGADLRGAIWDFSCLPLHCGSFGMKTDDRFTKQIARHLADALVNRDGLNDEEKALLKLLILYGNQFCEYRDDVKKLEIPRDI